MSPLKDKTVFITGASSGIGAACAKKFAAAGADLILTARRLDNLKKFADKLRKCHNVKVQTYSLDVREYQQAKKVVAALPCGGEDIDILINNAGLSLTLDKLTDGSPEDWDQMIDTNIKGVLYLSKLLAPHIACNSGHIINLGSIAGIYPYVGGAVYCASKAAVKIITDALRMELVDKPIKITNIQPGMVETEFSLVRFKGDTDRAQKVYEGITPLEANDIADICLYAASRPPHVQICEITVTALHQAPVGAVYRNTAIKS